MKQDRMEEAQKAEEWRPKSRQKKKKRILIEANNGNGKVKKAGFFLF